MTEERKFDKAAYGGKNWSTRSATHREEIGSVWANLRVNSEWTMLKQVLLHRPGIELEDVNDPEIFQMNSKPDLDLAQKQHDKIANKFREFNVEVHRVNPELTPSPNLMFCADLFFMTEEGAVLARPASTVRAGEERLIAKKLVDLGIPILMTLTGDATFEGADAMWLDKNTVLLGIGLRTNLTAYRQIKNFLDQINIRVVPVDLPVGTMHLMGILRVLDSNLAVAWPYRLAWKAYRTMQNLGFEVVFIPDEKEAREQSALNFVTLGPKEVLMAAGNPITKGFLENLGIVCHTVEVDELIKAAGGIACMTGILSRDIL